MAATWSVEARTKLLDQVVARYVAQGYRVLARTDTTAHLVRPKKFSFFWALFWTFLGFGIGHVFYLFWYTAKKDERLYLELDAYGTIHARQAADHRPFPSP